MVEVVVVVVMMEEEMEEENRRGVGGKRGRNESVLGRKEGVRQE